MSRHVAAPLASLSKEPRKVEHLAIGLSVYRAVYDRIECGIVQLTTVFQGVPSRKRHGHREETAVKRPSGF